MFHFEDDETFTPSDKEPSVFMKVTFGVGLYSFW